MQGFRGGCCARGCMAPSRFADGDQGKELWDLGIEAGLLERYPRLSVWLSRVMRMVCSWEMYFGSDVAGDRPRLGVASVLCIEVKCFLRTLLFSNVHGVLPFRSALTMRLEF